MFNGMSGDTLAEPGDEEGGVPGGTGRKAEAGDSAVAAHARAILEAAQAAAAANAPQEKTFRASHTFATVDTVASEFTYLGYATWKCAECGIWRVPGAPFCLSGEKAIFLKTCVLNDSSRLCCNCERQREQYYWKSKCIQLYRKGERSETQHIKLLDPPDRLVDLETNETVWSSAEGDKPMEAFKEIMKAAQAVDNDSSRTAWYSNMSCNQCRRRVGLRTHDELAKNKAIEFHELNMAAAAAKGKKGKKGKKKK